MELILNVAGCYWQMKALSYWPMKYLIKKLKINNNNNNENNLIFLSALLDYLVMKKHQPFLNTE